MTTEGDVLILDDLFHTSKLIVVAITLAVLFHLFCAGRDYLNVYIHTFRPEPVRRLSLHDN